MRSFEIVADSWRDKAGSPARVWQASATLAGGAMQQIRRIGDTAELVTSKTEDGNALVRAVISVADAELLLRTLGISPEREQLEYRVTENGVDWSVIVPITPAGAAAVATAALPDEVSTLPAWVGSALPDLHMPQVVAPHISRPSFKARVDSLTASIETIAKRGTLVLAGLGLLVIYFPRLQWIWEEVAMPSSWYQIGTLKSDPDGHNLIFEPGPFDSPAWKFGLKPDKLLALEGNDIVSLETAYGRSDSSTSASVDSVLSKDKCLHVGALRYSVLNPAESTSEDAIDEVSSSGDPSTRLGRITHLSFGSEPGTCQPLSQKEWGTREAKRVTIANAGRRQSEPGWAVARPYPALPVCRRINVWVEAKRVSC